MNGYPPSIARAYERVQEERSHYLGSLLVFLLDEKRHMPADGVSSVIGNVKLRVTLHGQCAGDELVA